jgi:hypothetical protein
LLIRSLSTNNFTRVDFDEQNGPQYRYGYYIYQLFYDASGNLDMTHVE